MKQRQLWHKVVFTKHFQNISRTGTETTNIYWSSHVDGRMNQTPSQLCRRQTHTSSQSPTLYSCWLLDVGSSWDWCYWNELQTLQSVCWLQTVAVCRYKLPHSRRLGCSYREFSSLEISRFVLLVSYGPDRSSHHQEYCRHKHFGNWCVPGLVKWQVTAITCLTTCC